MADGDAQFAASLARRLEALHTANGGDWLATARDAIALIRGAPAGTEETPDAPRSDD